MKLPIELWITEKAYEINVKKLFHESVVCYKNNAYRASLLFSYLGFLTIIKETIIKSTRPTAITDGRWNKILSDIKKDDKWEEILFNELVNEAAPIFNMNNDLRQQVKYWKDRRNDCAHFKRNEIEGHHIESFWSFLKSNISKMTIEGGMQSLLNKFDVHFDETFTPPNKNFDYLIKEISDSVDLSKREVFFKDLKSVIDGRGWWRSDSFTLKIYNRVIEIGDEQTQEDIITYIKKDNRDLGFLNAFPDKIVVMGYSAIEIRSLWKTRIYDKGNYTNPFNLYASLLKNKLIPNDEIIESHTEMYNRYSQTDYKKLPETKDIETLQANGFFSTVCKTAIDDYDLHDRARINNKADIITIAIKHSTLNIKTIETLCKMVSRTYYSWWLRDGIVELLNEDADFKKEFKKIAKANSITIPSEFK
jgi:hypothetical protein